MKSTISAIALGTMVLAAVLGILYGLGAVAMQFGLEPIHESWAGLILTGFLISIGLAVLAGISYMVGDVILSAKSEE